MMDPTVRPQEGSITLGKADPLEIRILLPQIPVHPEFVHSGDLPNHQGRGRVSNDAGPNDPLSPSIIGCCVIIDVEDSMHVAGLVISARRRRGATLRRPFRRRASHARIGEDSIGRSLILRTSLLASKAGPVDIYVDIHVAVQWIRHAIDVWIVARRGFRPGGGSLQRGRPVGVRKIFSGRQEHRWYRQNFE